MFSWCTIQICILYLTKACCLILIDAGSGYHNLKPDQTILYLLTFAGQLGRYMYGGLPFSTGPVGDIFQCKIDEIFKELPNVFDIADDNLIVSYKGWWQRQWSNAEMSHANMP